MTDSAALSCEMAEEFTNSVIHRVGLLLFIAGLAILAACASAFGNASQVISCSVYGATGVLRYG